VRVIFTHSCVGNSETLRSLKISALPQIDSIV
jgi:hypothetical protein